MSDNISKAITAGIFTLVGIVIGGILNYYFTISIDRERALQETRKQAYIEFLDAQEKWDAMRFEPSEDARQKLSEDYRAQTTKARKRIAVYGDKAVVEALGKYWRVHFERETCSGSSNKIKNDVSIYQKMREDIMPGDEQVSDQDMMMLLFLCQIPEDKSWVRSIFRGSK